MAQHDDEIKLCHKIGFFSGSDIIYDKHLCDIADMMCAYNVYRMQQIYKLYVMVVLNCTTKTTQSTEMLLTKSFKRPMAIGSQALASVLDGGEQASVSRSGI